LENIAGFTQKVPEFDEWFEKNCQGVIGHLNSD
jgi:hypothetical protein